MVDTLNLQIGEFFNKLDSKENVPRTGKALEKIIVILSAIYSSPLISIADSGKDILSHVRGILVTSLNARYQSLDVEASLNKDGFPLLIITNLLRQELERYSNTLDIIICEKLHLPSLCALVFYEPWSLSIEAFSQTFVSDPQEIGQVFELYHAVRDLQKVCEQIDFKLADKFPMVRWFEPFVMQWLSYSEKRLFDWVKSALDHDTLEKLSPQAAYSSSVLDLFTSFQEMADFVKDLDWPDERDARKFYFAVFYDIIGAIGRYSFLLVESLMNDLAITRMYQPPPAAKRAKLGKLRLSIPKMIRKKPLQTPVGEFRLSSRVISC